MDYSDEQVGLFDDVFQCLIDHIETSAKMLLANRLAPIDTAPPLTIRALAFDDVIEVAGPVLSQSMRLDDKTLIENARSKSQAHLMAISTRRTLSGAVTDVLVQRGNDEVIQSTVNNPGAEFTERGFTRLVNRAEGDDNLTACIGLRPSLPRHLYLKLLAKASDTVRQRLEAANPQQAAEVPTAVKEATRRARSATSTITKDTAIAHALVKSLYEDGRLDEFQVAPLGVHGGEDRGQSRFRRCHPDVEEILFGTDGPHPIQAFERLRQRFHLAQIGPCQRQRHDIAAEAGLQFARRADRLQASTVDDRDSVAELIRFIEIVGGQHDRDAASLQLPDVRPNFEPALDVQT